MLNINDGGSGGVPVVFVPSYAGCIQHWTGQLSHLRKTRRAIAIDLRGQGKSDPPANDDYAIDSLAADIGAVLDGLGLKKVILVGHSMGGAAALTYAGKHPDQVVGLVLIAAPGKLPEALARPVLDALAADFDKTMADHWSRLLADGQPNVKAQVERDRRRIPREASIAMIEATMTYDPMPALTSFHGPTWVIVTPANDQPFDLQHLVPTLVTTVVTGTSHWIQMDKPRVVNGILDGFLATIR